MAERVIRAATLALFVVSAFAVPRDATERQRFIKANPKPGPGYEVDHKKALINGGKDKPSNMQWLSHEEHKAKTKEDMAEHRASIGYKYKQVKKHLSKRLGRK